MFFQRKVLVRVNFLKITDIDTIKEAYTGEILVHARWREPELDNAEVGQSRRMLSLQYFIIIIRSTRFHLLVALVVCIKLIRQKYPITPNHPGPYSPVVL